MAMCPDCGNMIMEGDPYCERCGAHLSWSDEPLGDVKGERYSEPGLDDIIDSVQASEIQKSCLKAKLEGILEAADCTRLSARQGRGEYVFSVTRENEYVRTIDEFYFDPRDENMERVFCECLSHHNHDRLLKSPEFQRLIRATGLEFIGCRGGYKTELISILEGFRMLDEIDIIVYFRVSDKSERACHLDLEKMELKRCHDYGI